MPSSTGTKPMGLGREKPSSRSASKRASKRGAPGNSRRSMTNKQAAPSGYPRPFAVCVRNEDYLRRSSSANSIGSLTTVLRHNTS